MPWAPGRPVNPAGQADDPPRGRAGSPPSRPNRIALRPEEGNAFMAARPAQGSPTAARLIVGRRPFTPRAVTTFGPARSSSGGYPFIRGGMSTFPGRIWWLPTEGGARDAP